MNQKATNWLKNLLRDGRVAEVTEIRIAARAAGVTRSELRAAKQECRIIVKNNGRKERPADKWFWRLPEDAE